MCINRKRFITLASRKLVFIEFYFLFIIFLVYLKYQSLTLSQHDLHLILKKNNLEIHILLMYSFNCIKSERVFYYQVNTEYKTLLISRRVPT